MLGGAMRKENELEWTFLSPAARRSVSAVTDRVSNRLLTPSIRRRPNSFAHQHN
jgi:hypothetical protein